MAIKHNARGIAHLLVIGISSHWSLLFFCAITIFWLVAGFWLDFSELWQIILHITLVIITFVMVLLIQHIQHRETRSMQLKLDEILKGVEGSRNEFINIQTESDEHLDKLEEQTVEVKQSNIDKA